MKLSFHRRVQPEVNEAIRWYDEQRAGLGDEFFAQINDTLKTLAASPSHFGYWLASTSVRRAPLKRFPYAMLFEIKPDTVRVLCLRHNQRHPRFGLGRA